MNSMME